jgi:hypothetical protein
MRSRFRVLVDGYPVTVQPWSALPSGVDAIALPNLILIRSEYLADVDLLEHEFEHIRQWRHLGRIRFLFRYFADYLRGRSKGRNHQQAYHAISLEVQAREAASYRKLQRDAESGQPER